MASTTLSAITSITVTEAEADLRLDRWFRRHFPGLTHGRLEKLLRTGQVRLDGKRAKSADRVAAALIREGRVRRAYLGISAQDLPLPRRVVRHFNLAHETGARVEAVTPDSPAALAGMRAGDIIVALGETAITGVDDLQRVLTGGRIGEAVQVSVLRRDQRLQLAVTPRESVPSA